MVKKTADIRSLARGYTNVCMRTLGGWATDPKTDEEIKIRAIGMLLDRGWGKPQQDNTHEVKGEIRVVLRKMLEGDE